MIRQLPSRCSDLFLLIRYAKKEGIQWKVYKWGAFSVKHNI